MKRAIFVAMLVSGCGIQHYQSPNPAGPGHHPGLGLSFFNMDSAFSTIGTVWQASYRYGFNDAWDAGMNMDFFTRRPDTSTSARITTWTFTPSVKYSSPKFGVLRASLYGAAGYTFGTIYNWSSSGDTASYIIHLTVGASPGLVLGPITPYIPLRYTYGVPPDIEEIHWVGMFSGGLGTEARIAGHPLGFEALLNYAGRDTTTDNIIATLSWGLHFSW